MKLSHLVLALTVVASSSAFAQQKTVERETQRNVNQQERIQDGLKSGELSTKEAAKLEKEQAKTEKMQSKALADGKVTAKEAAKIEHQQDKVSKDIYQEKHDAKKGNPNSASSQRMQADVQRNINQQERINQGVKSGELTNKEVGKLERGQAHVNRAEAKAGADGHVGKVEQARVQRKENRNSRRIYRQKHDAQVR